MNQVEYYLGADFGDPQEAGRAQAERYKNADPFPSISFDNFFRQEALEEVLTHFPDLQNWNTHKFKNKNEVKFANNKVHEMPAPVRDFLYFMNSRPMLQFLEEMTGISNIIPDPMFTGGGCHEIKAGGFLKIHADFNIHPKYRLDRRINVLVYLNKDWEESYGGHFELWDKTMSRCVTKVAPHFNTMAVFSTTSDSYHGHPDPLQCPPDRSRKSLALYYYTNGRPKEEVEAGNEEHSTLFVGRQAEGDAHLKKNPLKSFVKDLTPPIILKALRKLRS